MDETNQRSYKKVKNEQIDDNMFNILSNRTNRLTKNFWNLTSCLINDYIFISTGA